MANRAHNKATIFSLLAVAVISVLLGILLQQKESKLHYNPQLAAGTYLSARKALQPFKLVTDNGKVFSKKNLSGRWTLLFFGFTRCPNICPMTLTKINQAYQLLEQQDNEILPQVVFVSVDPARDSAETIKRYVQSFNTAFIGATGSEAELHKLTKQVGVAYMKAIKSGEEGNYQIEHTGAIFVVDPSSSVAAILSAPFTAHTIAADVQRIQERG